MGVALITGSGGLIGSEAVSYFSQKFEKVIGIDNDQRKYFFGAGASVEWNLENLDRTVDNYVHFRIDIRDFDALQNIFKEYGQSIELIVHAAAQPSHDWAAKEPFTDFNINAVGTLNLLDLTRQFSSKATFIFTSTNKVYGDRPNSLPLTETDTRWELAEDHEYYKDGIDEKMSIDQSKHSLFGASKVAADVLAQEYGRYFGINVGVFRGGCLTGPNHSGAKLHGFLSYLMKCTMSGDPYTIFGYKGKQVRDNIHSHDLIEMFWQFHQKPQKGVVYNAGGGRSSNCSMIEAIEICQSITGKKLDYQYSDDNRVGDHIWWISDTSKFKSDYPDWKQQYDIHEILEQIFNASLTKGQLS